MRRVEGAATMTNWKGYQHIQTAVSSKHLWQLDRVLKFLVLSNQMRHQ